MVPKPRPDRRRVSATLLAFGRCWPAERPTRWGDAIVLRYSSYAKATFRKDRRLNIRISTKDLEAIKKRALEERLPYQTLIASLLHKYASGRLRER